MDPGQGGEEPWPRSRGEFMAELGFKQSQSKLNPCSWHPMQSPLVRQGPKGGVESWRREKGEGDPNQRNILPGRGDSRSKDICRE